MTQKSQFDPGIGNLVYAFEESISDIKSVLTAVKSPQQRKFRFKLAKKQILEIVKNNAAFYLGCLIWAKHLKEDMPDAEIENNPFYGVNIEDKNLSPDELCGETTSYLNYFEQFKKDCKFFAGENSQLPQYWLEIGEAYKEFLIANNFFTKVKTGADIVIPDSAASVIKQDKAKGLELIEQTVNSRNLALLLEE